MLLECYLIDEEGTEKEIEPENLELRHSTLAIVVSHTEKCIYIFKGNKVSIVQKFASARAASAMRLKFAYNVRHVEETEGIDEVFIPVMEYLGGIIEDEEEEEKAPPKKKATAKTTAKAKAAAKKTTTKKSTTAKKTTTKKSTTAKKTTTKKSTTAKKTTTKKTTTKTPIETKDLPAKLAKVVKTMVSLDPPERSSCDYLIVDSKLYIILGDNKTDLRDGEFSLEEVSTLPEGVFPAENYFPRILIAKQKVIGIELWTRK